jgi:hypothetical protein
MLTHFVRTLFVDVLNHCFFDPAMVLCLARTGRQDSTPALSLCQRDRCQTHASPIATGRSQKPLSSARVEDFGEIAAAIPIKHIYDYYVAGCPATRD